MFLGEKKRERIICVINIIIGPRAIRLPCVIAKKGKRRLLFLLKGGQERPCTYRKGKGTEERRKEVKSFVKCLWMREMRDNEGEGREAKSVKRKMAAAVVHRLAYMEGGEQMSPQVGKTLVSLIYMRVCVCVECGKRHTRHGHKGGERTRGDKTHHHHLYVCPSNRDIATRRNGTEGEEKGDERTMRWCLAHHLVLFTLDLSSLSPICSITCLCLILLCHHHWRPTY